MLVDTESQPPAREPKTCFYDGEDKSVIFRIRNLTSDPRVQLDEVNLLLRSPDVCSK